MPEGEGQSAAYYGEGEGAGSPLEKIKGLLGPLKKFGIGKIVMILAILLALYVYMFVLAKPGAMVVTVVELDNEATAIAGAEVELTADGNLVGSSVTDESGSIRFSNVPSQQSLMVRVAEAGLYTSASATAPALESGASGSLRVRVPKKKSLELSGSIPSTVLAPRCAKTFSLQVKNTGDVDEEVEFVGDKLSGIQLRSETKIIPAGGAEDVQFTVETGDSSSGKATGTVRLKYTNKGMALDFPLAEAPKLEVSPTDVTCRELLCNYVVTIKNNGKSTVSDITATPRGSEALTSKMRFEGITAPLVTKALPPGQDVKFALVVEGTEGGSYTAFLDVEATCFAKSISVKSERK